jgi:hypothetical protein
MARGIATFFTKDAAKATGEAEMPHRHFRFAKRQLASRIRALQPLS